MGKAQEIWFIDFLWLFKEVFFSSLSLAVKPFYHEENILGIIPAS